MKRIAAVLGFAITVSALLPLTHAVAEVETNADLKVSVTGPASVTPGSNATYQMTIRNDGPDTVQSAGVHANWNRNFNVPFSGVTGVTGFCEQSLPPAPPDYFCEIANMPIAPGDTRTVTFTGNVEQAASGQVEFTANVLSSGNVDPVPDDNSGQVTSVIVPPSPLASH
jgi:hypothetical protein